MSIAIPEIEDLLLISPIITKIRASFVFWACWRFRDNKGKMLKAYSRMKKKVKKFTEEEQKI